MTCIIKGCWTSTQLLLLLFLFCAPPHLAQPAAGDGASETDLLLAFKDSFTNGEELLPSWVNGTDLCAWQGVACSANGFVDRVELLDLGLEGTIPEPDGWVLPPKMTALALGNNRISGPIPAGWKLPATLTTLYFTSNQLSGSLSPDWNLGDGESLQFVLFDKNNLSGPLPEWRLPPRVQSFVFQANRLTGTIPASFTISKSVQIMDLSNNSISGPLPSSFSFNTSQELYGLFVWGNNLSGPLPTWPESPKAAAIITPGNGGLCGAVPSGSPQYLDSSSTINQPVPVQELPPCEGDDSGGGSSNTALIAGLVGGIGGALVLTIIVAAFFWRKKKNKSQETLGAAEADMEKGSAESGSDTTRPTAITKGAFSSNGDGLHTSSLDGSLASQIPTPSEGSLANDPLLSSLISKLSSSDSSGLKSGSKKSSEQRSSRSARSLGVDVKAYVIPFQDLQLHSQIGRGAFARVYLATWREVKVAAKLLLGPEVDKESDTDAAASQMLSPYNPVIEHLQQEASLISALRHPNVLSFIGICTTPPVLVMEYCPRGSLYGILKSASTSQAMARQLDWTVRLKMAIGGALGMLYLHSCEPPILHRDLKSPNLLISDNWTVKVADFNLSKILGESSLSNQSSTAIGNPRWLAPEVLAGDPHSFASDVFSFGLVLWEILTFRAPWEGATNMWQISAAIIKGSRPPLPDPSEVPGPMELRSGAKFEGLQAYMQLIQDCWAQSPADRPAFGDVVSRLRALVGASDSPLRRPPSPEGKASQQEQA